MFTHHAYLLEGTPTLLPEAERVMRERGGFASNSPDVSARAYEKFGIDDARELVERATMKSSAGHSLFLVATTSITTEAQQALLKLFEEPQVGAVFVLIVPHGTVLPTLRSRCLPLVLAGAALGTTDADAHAKEFLRLGNKERSAMVADLVKEYEDDRAAPRVFLDALEREVYRRFQTAPAPARPELAEHLSDIATFRSYLSDRSPSIKMLFEHLAASIKSC